MNIQLEKIDESISIIEYVIRPLKREEHGEQYSSHCFQANFNAKKSLDDQNLCAQFSYYDEQGEFLGLDNDDEWIEVFDASQPYSMSCDLNIPEHTHRVVCRITLKKAKFDAWDTGWRVFALLVFAFLISHIVKIWM